MFKSIVSVVVCGVVLVMGGVASGEAAVVSPTDEDVRGVVQRSIPYIEREGQAWIAERNCVSCHQVPSMIWSLNEADRRGFELDRDALTKWTRWSYDQIAPTGKAAEDFIAVKEVDTFHALILGRDRAGDEASRASAHTMAHSLVDVRNPDGTWRARGQLPYQRRPASESHDVSTMWSLLALHSLGGECEELAVETDEHLKRFRAAEVGKSNEWLITRILNERAFGDEAIAAELVEELLVNQRADGGWSWLRGDASDGFATGQSLYVLSQNPTAEAKAAIERGRAFLVASQNSEGSWPMKTTVKKHAGEVLPTATYWSTTWAAIGLMQTLDVKKGECVANGR